VKSQPTASPVQVQLSYENTSPDTENTLINELNESIYSKQKDQDGHSHCYSST